ncbi:hypothetical protein BATDEDRAFT_85816 [Batrachochytrium dendrobatidis JAM81]|uniref:Coiled-coil domain-containing protein 112 n=1 Tax=Batrachochytrium dendrobatidis (strain JAM81 / FGSC 10211) TaxID=684364 RepID=F4NUY2_BATDJ|nr:uncharacterized protein BATDEDRAFT_85816 [Batrachochytrium dendrobatidis JAM81]EGF83225.1 hypothetical protein BATDEDRAFT_85816 [Batrachochytrium dendrobatidis JAM81]|eukprot:XP_006676023.1 hypothetical protein BATDEDRAFT_85816 [Batrachochytrium dendrobatidis JAM81]
MLSCEYNLPDLYLETDLNIGESFDVDDCIYDNDSFESELQQDDAEVVTEETKDIDTTFDSNIQYIYQQPQSHSNKTTALQLQDSASVQQYPNNNKSLPARKVNSRDKKEFMETWIRQKSKIASIERELISIQSKANFHEAVQAYPTKYNQIQNISVENDIKSECKNMHDTISHIRHRVNALVDMKKNPKNDCAYIDTLKQTVESIESDIQSFKIQSRSSYGKLVNEERLVKQELKSMEERIQNWEMQLENIPAKVHGVFFEQVNPDSISNRRNGTHVSGLLPEVIRFQKFLAQWGGHYGGWDSQNHAAFLKYRLKFGDAGPKFLQHCVQYIPGVCEQDVQDHELWLSEYLRHAEAQKQAIANWKHQKQMSIDAVKATFEEKETQKNTVQSTPVENIQEKEWRKEQIKQWKTERENRQKQQDMLKETKQRQIQQKMNAKRQSEQLKAKRLLNEYKERRAKIKEQEAEWKQCMTQLTAKDCENLKSDSRQIQARFIQKNNEIIQNKLRLQKQKMDIAQERQRQIDQTKYHVFVEKDPNRLLKPTMAHTNRIAANTAPALDQKILSKFTVNTIPRRSIPSWRAEV